MASLSNINGLFDVHSTGAILFSNTHGTSGQILRSNGNAAPTWVAASTVIGGPYLPLTGGTLTGATATATGISFTVGGNLFVTGTSTLTGALSGSTGTFSGSGTILSLNRNAPGTALIELKIANTIEGYLGATTTKSFVVYSEAGSEKAHVENNGNIGLYGSAINFLIGGPGGINFRESGAITIDSDNNQSSRNFQFKDGNGSSLMLIEDTGNVGIGTAAPLALLNIEGPNNQDGNDYAQLYIKGTGTYPDDIAGVVLDSVGSHQSHIRFSNNGSPKFQLRYNEGGNTIDKLMFYSFTQGNDMMTLDGATGNVGIGTSSPSAKLTIDNGSASGGSLLKSSNSSYTAHFIANTGTGSAGIYMDAMDGDFIGSNYGFIGQNNAGYMEYTVSPSSPLPYHYFAQNVGIGVTGPTYALDVVSSAVNNSARFRNSAGGDTLVRIIAGDYNTEIDARLFLGEDDTHGITFEYDGSANMGYIGMNNNVDPTGAYSKRIQMSRGGTEVAFMAGNVGIGTSSPASSYGFSRTLEIQGAVNAEINISQSNNGKDWSLGIVNGANYQQTTSGQDYIWLIGGSEKMRITSGGNVGIGNTNPYSVLDVDGVIANRMASQDPNFTVTVVGMTIYSGGSLQFTQGFAGTSAAGDTIVFRYNAASWKSWSLDYTFASTSGLVKGTIGGYNNNSGGGSNFFLINNFGITAVATGSGQNVIVTFTGNFGIHVMCDMRYSQGGGDAYPRSDRASLTYTS